MSTTSASQTLSEHDDKLGNPNKLMQALLIAAIAASGLSMIFSIGTAYVSANQDSTQSVASVEHTLD
jgi:hypothetical protein